MDGSLNSFLQPLNAPVTDTSGQVSGYEFSRNYDRNAVSVSKIRNFNFNSGTGGTLTLGGAANGNGYFQIKDSSGSVIVIGNNQGLTINGGNIVVKNSSNTTIIDTSGIVSTANFALDQAFSNIQQVTASSSYVDVTGSSLSFTLSRPSRILIGINVGGFSNTFDSLDSSMMILCTDSVDGDQASFPVFGSWAVTNIDFVGQSWTNLIDSQEVGFSIFEQFSAGSHSLKLQFKAQGGGTAKLNDFLLNYMILGS